MTPLGLLNFVVLQWFGVRLARVTAPAVIMVDGRADRTVTVTVGWRVLHWICPLTGWWSDYRWIARRR